MKRRMIFFAQLGPGTFLFAHYSIVPDVRKATREDSLEMLRSRSSYLALFNTLPRGRKVAPVTSTPT